MKELKRRLYMIIAMFVLSILSAISLKYPQGKWYLFAPTIALSIPILYIPFVKWLLRRIKNKGIDTRRKSLEFMFAFSIIVFLACPWWLVLSSNLQTKETIAAPLIVFCTAGLPAFIGTIWLAVKAHNENSHGYWMSNKMIAFVVLLYLFLPLLWGKMNGLS